MRRVVALLVLVAAVGCTSDGEDAAGASSSSTVTRSGDPPLACPGGRTETATLDAYGGEPEKAYQGGDTPEEGLEHGGYDRSQFTRLEPDDPGHVYVNVEKPYVTFARVEADGRRTMLVWVRPAGGGGWVARGHIACAGPS